MKIVSGNARKVERVQATPPSADVSLLVTVTSDDSRGLELVKIRIQPMPEVKVGDELVLACGGYLPSGRRAFAYANRSNGTHGRESLNIQALVIFGVVGVGITIGLVAAFGWIGTLTIPVIGLVLSMLVLDARKARRGLDLVLAHAKELEAKRKRDLQIEEKKKQEDIARQKAEAARQKAEAARRATMLPILLAIEDHHRNNCRDFGWNRAEKAIRVVAVPGDSAVFDALLATLNSPDVGKRALAAHALSMLENPAAIPALLRKFHGSPPADFEESMSYDEQEQRDVMGTVSGTELLREEQHIREVAAFHCGQSIRDVSTWTFKALLKGGALDPTTFFQTLIDLVVDPNTQNDAVRKLDLIDPNWPASAAARAIVPSLLPLLAFDKSRDYSTAKILCRIGDKRALAPLQAMSSCPVLKAFMVSFGEANPLGEKAVWLRRN